MNKQRQITSMQHPIVKHFVRLRHNRDYREEHNSALIEGKKLVSELCTKQPAKTIMTTELGSIPKDAKAEEIILVPPAVMQKVSGVLTPEGILAEVILPPQHSLERKKWIIVVDGINDPGNLGTLLRTALALGWEGCLILESSCDPYNDKAIRAAKGATFRLPLLRGHWEDVDKLISKNSLIPILADMEGTPIDVFKDKKLNGALLVLSNEAHGSSEKAKSVCQRVSIPMKGDMESMNVAIAGAILMYELKTL